MHRTIRVKSAADTAAFFQLFCSDTPSKRYAFGINEYAESLARIADIDGYIDDFTVKSDWLGKPVLRLADVAPDSLIVSCVTASFPVRALCNLAAAGILNYVDYFSLADASGGRLPQVSAITETRADFSQHAEDYAWVRRCLSDDASRETFDRLLDFRLKADLRAMTQFDYAAERQYFEPFLELGKAEVFVDGGGFDGYTSAEFARRNPSFSAIHLFEPSAETLAVARQRLASVSPVVFHQLGLYDRPTSLHFDSSAGSASRIAEDGSVIIEVARLDDVVAQPVSFVKMDLEGAELAALRGARQHIAADHPKLAVAVYHRPSDFWEIPRFVLGVCDDYRVFLRHYTEGWTETVMFFVPKRA